MKVTIGTIDEFERQALFSRRVVRQAADGILCSRRRGGEQHEEQQRGPQVLHRTATDGNGRLVFLHIRSPQWVGGAG